MSVLNLLDFGGARGTPVIYQSEASECGLACLAMVAAHHGLDADMPAYRRRFAMGLRGANLKRIMEIADLIGLGCRPLRVDLHTMGELRLPAIIHWNMNHFVVLTRISSLFGDRRYRIHDPAAGDRLLREDEFSRLFTGVALEITKTARFQPQSARSRFGIKQLWSSIHGARRALASVLTLSVILQVISLVTPFYLQIALDSVLPTGDRQLMKVLAIGFGGLVIIETLAGWLRTVSLLNMTNAFSFQIIDNLYRHLVRLPLSWFEKRHVGDVVSRFGSTQPITDFVSQGMMSSVLDGLMAFFTLVLMFVYSAKLAAISLVAWGLYALLRILSFTVMRQTNISSITASARENSAFMETVRGISTIKAFGHEATRQRMWQTLKATAINAQLKLGRLTAGFDAASSAALGAERVLFVWLAIGLAMRGGFTIGMIFAFQAYKGQFLGAATRLVDQALHYQLIDVHLTRIADIALSPAERIGSLTGQETAARGEIELRNVSFRYGTGDPFILRNVNLHIMPGEMIAFVGPSGGGKTTLLKIMMGLLAPTSGDVLIDGQPLAHIDLRRWRSQIGSLLQDDQLFAGSLAENIAFFDPEINMTKVREVCRLSAVLTEIESMPQGLETSVGDMGSSLSGGQKQRVMLARALYPNPALLFMDEVTANLDPATEAAIVDTLRTMSITRLISAHRPLAISVASRVFVVHNGIVRKIEQPRVPTVKCEPILDSDVAVNSGSDLSSSHASS